MWLWLITPYSSTLSTTQAKSKTLFLSGLLQFADNFGVFLLSSLLPVQVQVPRNYGKTHSGMKATLSAGSSAATDHWKMGEWLGVHPAQIVLAARAEEEFTAQICWG